MVNPVWAKYVAEQMPSWLEWFRNIHLKSYVELADKFIQLNPYYVPNDDGSEAVELFDTMIVNREFFDSVTDAGVRVWANSGFYEFVEALDIYSSRYPEINMVCRLFNHNINWFKRIYQFLRAELIMELRNDGRNL